MVANPERRAAVCDAALELLGRDGARAVTHREVDAEAGLPRGTCSNYFPSRSALFGGMAERLFTVLVPEEGRLGELDALTGRRAGPEYVVYGLERLLARPNLARAWIELRLEAGRSAELADRVGQVVRAGFEANTAFSADRGLPGGQEAVALLHHLVDGVLLDALTVPLDRSSDPAQRLRAGASAILRVGALQE